MSTFRVGSTLAAGGVAALAAASSGASAAGAAVTGLLTIAGVLAAPSFLRGVASGAFSRRAGPSAGRTAAMSGVEFEDHVAHLARRGGLPVTMTPASGDWGVDLIVGRRPHRIAVQCKRQARPVGVAAVQQVVAGASMQDCSRTMVVTDAGFTPAARRLAEHHGTVLVTGDALPRLGRLLRDIASATC